MRFSSNPLHEIEFDKKTGKTTSLLCSGPDCYDLTTYLLGQPDIFPYLPLFMACLVFLDVRSDGASWYGHTHKVP